MQQKHFKESVFSSNVIVPDSDGSNPLDLAQRLSLKFNSNIGFGNSDFTNENVESLNNAGIAQLQHLSEEGSIWKMCKEGLIDKLKNKLESNDNNFDPFRERGTFGETILHVAILYKQENIIKYVIKKYPLLINEIYEYEEYYGETGLHMTVINRDYALTEYLLNNDANPNNGRATGRFFDKEKGTVYYGESAITFAISTHQCDMIELLHRYGAKLDIVDCYGNSVFHHCVRMDSPKIFDCLMKLKQSEDPTFDMSSLNEIKNNQGLSALQYAVELGKKDIFDHMLEKMKIIGWEWGDVAFYAYPITEIDTHGDNTNSVLETIIIEHRSSFILNPVIYEVFLEKWNNYGLKIFIIWFILHLIYCILLTLTCLQFPFDIDAGYNIVNYKLWLQCCLLCICLKVMIITCMELWEFYLLIKEHGFKRGWHIYFEKGNDDKNSLASILSVTGIFKLIAWFSNILSIIGMICLMLNNLIYFRALMVFTMLFEWLQILVFGQTFKSTGRLIVTITKILAKDVSRFISIYIVILCAFSSALALLINTDGNTETNDWSDSMFIMFEISLGMGAFFGKNMTNPFDITLSQVLYVIYLLLSVVLLFNLLIAIMTETTEEVRQQATEQWLLQWASTVLLLERRAPKCLYKRTGTPGIKFGFTSNKKKQNEYFITFTQTKQHQHNNVIRMFRESTFISDMDK